MYIYITVIMSVSIYLPTHMATYELILMSLPLLQNQSLLIFPPCLLVTSLSDSEKLGYHSLPSIYILFDLQIPVKEYQNY